MYEVETPQLLASQLYTESRFPWVKWLKAIDKLSVDIDVHVSLNYHHLQYTAWRQKCYPKAAIMPKAHSKYIVNGDN